jgi:hypothetical protein
MFPDNVKFISTPRFIEGGAGADCFGNFNLALHVGDESSAVNANRELLEKHYKLPSSPQWINQTHSSVCIRLDSKSSLADADASYSRTSGVVCGVLTADCMPVFVCDKMGTVVGIAHAGWRGLVGGVIESLIEEMNVEGSELIVHLGPAISQSAYEVGIEVKTQFLDRNSIFERSFIEKNDKHYLDLYDGAKVILEGYGITSISGGDCCTYEDSKQFFSYRRDGECSGRMAHLIWMV